MTDARAKPRTTLAEKVYHLLFTRISNGEYEVNQKLPRKTLCHRNSASRARFCAPRWSGCVMRG